jgi:type II secretory pathway component GspD/PulD (secretin)
MMKQNQTIGTCYLLAPVRMLFLLSTIIVLCGIARADSISSHWFSMTIRDQSVSEAFQRLSTASGLEIIYNNALKNQRVNVHLENDTIEKALQKMLLHSNHTIIFDGNTSILIDVYGAGTSDATHSGTSVARTTRRKVPRKSSNQKAVSSQNTGAPRPLTADEQYLEDERAAGNIP